MAPPAAKRLKQSIPKKQETLCLPQSIILTFPVLLLHDLKRQGFKIKVVEKARIVIKRLLQRSDPCKPRQCEREDCLVCRTGGKGPYDRQSVTYEVKCTECNNIYVGTT